MIVGHFIDKLGKHQVDGTPKMRVGVGLTGEPSVILEVAKEIDGGPDQGKQREFLVYLSGEDIPRLKEAIKVLEVGKDGIFNIS